MTGKKLSDRVHHVGIRVDTETYKKLCSLKVATSMTQTQLLECLIKALYDSNDLSILDEYR